MNYSLTIPSLLILVVIMGYYFLRPRLPIRLNRAFLAILVIDIFTVLFDFIACRLDETWTEHAPLLLWILNTLFYVFYLSRSYMFFVFTISVLDSRGVLRSGVHVYTPVIYFPCAAVALLSPLTHWMFYMDAQGFHPGPLYFLIYVCSLAYLIFSVWAVLRHRKSLTGSEITGLFALQAVLLVGNIVRLIVPNMLVMNTFCLIGIVIIYLSFLNPDLFLSDRGYIYNLPAFRALLQERVRQKIPFRIVAFALENYNEHREIFGGAQMDEALQQISKYLSLTFPDLVSFYLRGGAFAVVGHAERMDPNDVCSTLETCFSSPWKTGACELLLQASFVRADEGLQNCTSDRLVNTLLISLDEAGQAARPGSHHSLSDSMDAIGRKLDIRRCLENALANDSLEVFLQPIVDGSSGRRIAAEALVRLRDEKGRVIPPDEFITLAEREGHIEELGEQVLGKVCAFIRNNDLDSLDIRWINVNLSPVQFMSQRIPERFSAILRQYDVDTKRIRLEITEQSMIDFSLLREQIDALHAAGFQFALDDYGSGYSNLTRVRQYPFSNIKIDMEVVRNYFREKDPLLPALISAFRRMDFSVTAEGIETPEMAEALRSIGCDYLQGYYFSRPVPMSEFLALA